MRWLALALLLVPTLASADWTPGSCTDGTNCLCDSLSGDASVIWCEDFEDASYDDGGAGWGDVYRMYPGPIKGGTNPTCAKGGNSANDYAEGTDVSGVGNGAWECFNMVQPGACDGPDSDCVFDGGQALGNRYDYQKAHGKFGEGTPYHIPGYPTHFGVTYLYKFSSNFERGPSNPGFKGIEWGVGLHSIGMGQFANSSGTPYACAGSGSDIRGDTTHPLRIWDGMILFAGFVNPSSGYSATLGCIANIDGKVGLYPRGSAFSGGDFAYTAGDWECLRFEVTGWTTSTTRIQQWVQGESDAAEVAVLDVTFDGSTLKEDAGYGGLYGWAFNNYQNGHCYQLGQNNVCCGYGATGNDGTNCVYANGDPGRAYRYEDNFVITDGTPKTCAEVGYYGSGAGNPTTKARWKHAWLDDLMLRGWSAALLPAGVGR